MASESVFDRAASTDGATGVWWNEAAHPPGTITASRVNVIHDDAEDQTAYPLPASMFVAGTATAYPGRLVLRNSGNRRRLNMSTSATGSAGAPQLTTAVAGDLLIAIRITGTSIVMALEPTAAEQATPTDPYDFVVPYYAGFTSATDGDDDVTDAFIDEAQAAATFDVVFVDTSHADFALDTLTFETDDTVEPPDPEPAAGVSLLYYNTSGVPSRRAVAAVGFPGVTTGADLPTTGLKAGDLHIFSELGPQGAAIEDESFDMAAANTGSEGIEVTSSRIYVVDSSDNRVYVYNHAGVEQTRRELQPSLRLTLMPAGISVYIDAHLCGGRHRQPKSMSTIMRVWSRPPRAST